MQFVNNVSEVLEGKLGPSIPPGGDEGAMCGFQCCVCMVSGYKKAK